MHTLDLQGRTSPPLRGSYMMQRHPKRTELGHWKGHKAIHSLTRREGQNVMRQHAVSWRGRRGVRVRWAMEHHTTAGARCKETVCGYRIPAQAPQARYGEATEAYLTLRTCVHALCSPKSDAYVAPGTCAHWTPYDTARVTSLFGQVQGKARKATLHQPPARFLMAVFPMQFPQTLQGTQHETPAFENTNRRPSLSHTCFMLVGCHCERRCQLQHSRCLGLVAAVRQPSCCSRCNHTAWGVGT